ncbi:MAG: NUDIX domain-containing protein [Nitrospinae bacterium]|nr:NUDIX domain-containing protein [Nitrospinota bacterium]
MDPRNSQEDEVFDVVDENDNVIGRAARGEVHRKSLLHRSVHILVFNAAGDLFLQKRAMTKDRNPGLWDSSAAGHVNSREDYFPGACRELREELSIGASLRSAFKFKASAETGWEHVAIYTCVTDQNIVCHPDEISEGRYWNIEEIRNALRERPEQFTSTFRAIFNNYDINKYK